MSDSMTPPAPPDTSAGDGSGKIMQTIYEHGGSRIWMQSDDGRRDLLADTYDGEELAKKVRATIEAHFFPNKD